MKAKDVKPDAWCKDENYPIRILFDSVEENYSVIWGKYGDQKTLGVRWNGGTNRGYPGQGGHPTWYVEPDFISIVILQRLLNIAIDNDDTKYLKNIKFAINELTDKMTEK